MQRKKKTRSHVEGTADPTILRVADIYCGAGGLSAGFARARAAWSDNSGERFQIVYGLDRDQDAVESFNAYHKKAKHIDKDNLAQAISVTEVDGQNILDYAGVNKIDVLIGGPNCQGVSAAGLRNPKDKRNEMFRRFVELVEELQPAWFVMENVPGLTHLNNRDLLFAILKRLGDIKGYRVEADVLLAAHFGVPQFRYRVFFIGNRIGAPIRFPEPKFSNVGDFKTVKDAIWDLRKAPTDPEINHEWMEIEKDNRTRIEAIEPGEDWRDMPVRLLPERFFATRASDQKGTYGRLEWKWPAYTITSSVSNVTAGPFTHPDVNRPLSVREAARLQSFEDRHIFKGTIDSQYRQVGNAVPPKLAQAVAEAVLSCHFRGADADKWGKSGRITLELLEKSKDGEVTFPTLTPRFPGRTPRWDRNQTTKKPGEKKPKETKARIVWEVEQRLPNPHKQDMKTLKTLAAQPGNYRAAKRARAIVAYFAGKTKEEILKEASVSAKSVEKWIRGWIEGGLDGWRAYHSDPALVFGDDKQLTLQIVKALSKVRAASSEIRLSQNGNKRLHMNDYLLGLRERFGKYSTRELISKVEKESEKGIGTVYVGDLLAICGVVVKPKPRKNARR